MCKSLDCVTEYGFGHNGEFYFELKNGISVTMEDSCYNIFKNGQNVSYDMLEKDEKNLVNKVIDGDSTK